MTLPFTCLKDQCVKVTWLYVLALFFLLSCKAMSINPPSGHLIDLSYAYDSETVFWPTEEGFHLEKESEGMTDKGYYYASNKFSTPEHGGTHIDAPRHFSQNGRTVDEIPLEQLMGAGVLVDVSTQCNTDPDHLISIADFQEWEKHNGTIQKGSLVLLRTGYGKYWPNRLKYLGTAERGREAVAKLHFPGLDPEAARWLIEQRAIKAVGIDTASIDYGQSQLFETHRALFEKNVPAFENLANLDQLPVKTFTVIALPMKIKGGSGGPLRIVAMVPSGI